MAGKVRNTDEKILLALSVGTSQVAAAREAGVSERTIRRKLADPKFRARLHQLRGEALERAGGMLTAGAMKSVATLLALQESNQPAAVRLGAAKAVLELGMRVREMNELEARLAALEAQLGDGHPRSGD
jgi:hypothetical protein